MLNDVQGGGAEQLADPSQLRVGIVHACWNKEYVESILGACTDRLMAHGVPAGSISRLRVPGAPAAPLHTSLRPHRRLA